MRHSTVAPMLLVLVWTTLLMSCSQDEGQAAGKTGSSVTERPMMEMHEPGRRTGHGMTLHGQGMEAQETHRSPPMNKGSEAPPVAAGQETAPASGANAIHEVKAAVTRFVPMVLFVQPGDTVHWVNMAGHNTHSIEGMIPPGAEKWESVLGVDYSRRFTLPGAYVYKCVPHASLGMEGIIVVGGGKPANLEEIDKSPLNKGMIGRAVRKLHQALTGRNG